MVAVYVFKIFNVTDVTDVTYDAISHLYLQELARSYYQIRIVFFGEAINAFIHKTLFNIFNYLIFLKPEQILQMRILLI